jgi:hypothetical protein
MEAVGRELETTLMETLEEEERCCPERSAAHTVSITVKVDPTAAEEPTCTRATEEAPPRPGLTARAEPQLLPPLLDAAKRYCQHDHPKLRFCGLSSSKLCDASSMSDEPGFAESAEGP